MGRRSNNGECPFALFYILVFLFFSNLNARTVRWRVSIHTLIPIRFTCTYSWIFGKTQIRDYYWRVSVLCTNHTKARPTSERPGAGIKSDHRLCRWSDFVAILAAPAVHLSSRCGNKDCHQLLKGFPFIIKACRTARRTHRKVHSPCGSQTKINPALNAPLCPASWIQWNIIWFNIHLSIAYIAKHTEVLYLSLKACSWYVFYWIFDIEHALCFSILTLCRGQLKMKWFGL